MGRTVLLHLEPYKLFGALLHYVKHVPNSVTLLQTLLVTLELISEVLDNEPFQTLCFFVAGCVLHSISAHMWPCMPTEYAVQLP